MNTEQYIAALKAHDWFYGYADDPDIYGKGKAQRDALNRARPEIDPDWEIWNQHCPPHFLAKPIFSNGANQ